MFSGMNPPNPNPELPASFRKYLDYMNDGNQERYNQTVNGYQDCQDYIASQCNAVPDSDSAIITLNRQEERIPTPPRIFRIQPKGSTLDSVAPKVEIELIHGRIIIIGGATQHKFRHSVPKQPQAAARVSITLRSYHPPTTSPIYASALPTVALLPIWDQKLKCKTDIILAVCMEHRNNIQKTDLIINTLPVRARYSNIVTTLALSSFDQERPITRSASHTPLAVSGSYRSVT